MRSESGDDDGNNEAMRLRPNEEKGRRVAGDEAKNRRESGEVKGRGVEAGVVALHRAAHQQKGGYGADWESKVGSVQDV